MSAYVKSSILVSRILMNSQCSNSLVDGFGIQFDLCTCII